MYIIKNALRSINRAKGRNILIGMIVLVIAISSCVALSIREAANSAKEAYLDDMQITAQISMDRTKMMEDFNDRESMRDMMMSQQEISLEELLTYAEADSVKEFYYSGTTSVNTDESWEPIDVTGISENEEEDAKEFDKGLPGTGQNKMDFMQGTGFMGNQGDVTLIGYSSDEAMVDFLAGTSYILEGEMFEEGTTAYQCAVSDELATYNNISVGDIITILNPNDEAESYELTVTGIYHNEQSGQNQAGMMRGFSTSQDAANQIYISYAALERMISNSEANATTESDESTGMTRSTALKNQVSGSYVFESVEKYEAFEEEARTLGLGENYTISSSDLSSYEQSLKPLENLSEYAMYFFVVILIIGGVVLAVLNIFNIRERKYEIGVLAAIGMKKWKIAVQYVTELLCVTFIAMFIGTGIGAVGSVPITNMLLEKQISSQTQVLTEQMGNFGRDEMPEGIPSMPAGDGQMSGGMFGGGIRGSMQEMFGNMPGSMVEYVDEIESATNLNVVMKLMGVGVLLTMVSSLFAVIFVLRYDPLKIMANRD